MDLSKKSIAVVGPGYVGLPLAALCAKKSYSVTGLDANEKIVKLLGDGKSHIKDGAVEILLATAQAFGALTQACSGLRWRPGIPKSASSCIELR